MNKTFNEWLDEQTDRDDRIGRFAKDAAMDNPDEDFERALRDIPPKPEGPGVTRQDWQDYLVERRVFSPGPHRTLEQAWDEFEATRLN